MEEGGRIRASSGSRLLAQVSNFFSNVFKFRKTSLTIFTILSYIIVVSLDFYAEYSALQVPEPEPYYLSNAWTDLQVITKKPHPYTSHANDEVFEYLSNRVSYYASRNPGVVLYETDFGARSLFKQRDVFNDSSTDTRVIYYESGNVYVKIDGSDPDLSALLVSAHYDSVPTAPGAIDDGQGISTMLAILDYYTTNKIQPLRTIIFNFNNDEEFGLLGATVFFNHPWAKQVEYFINLEGTGAGGRAILFRTTNYGLAKYYKNVPSPFASSVFQQGFRNRFISSETDYKVYDQNGLKGFDIAFYKPRSLYHTIRDSIASTTKGSLHHMMSNTLALVQTLSEEQEIDDDDSPAVFFDVFGKYFVIFSINTLYTINIVSLVVIPLVHIVLLIIIFRRHTWNITHSKLSALFRLPISLLVSGLMTTWVSDMIQRKNPFVVSLNYNIVLLVLTATSVLFNYLILTFFNNVLKIHDQKLVVLIELNFFFWLLSTRQLPPNDTTGEWLSTLLYILFSITTTFGLFSLAIKQQKLPVISIQDYGSVDTSVDTSGDTSGDNSDDSHADTDNAEQQSIESHGDTNDESSPLLGPSHDDYVMVTSKNVKKTSIDSFNYDWSIQYLMLVPISLYFIYFNIHELLQAIYQNSHYGDNSINQIFSFMQAFALALTIPILAFVHKLNYVVRLFLLLAIIVGSFVATSVFPFTYSNPLKVTFYQEIELDHGSKPMVRISGSESYLKGYLEDLPSVKASNVSVDCVPNTRTAGLETCSYEGLEPNLISASSRPAAKDILSYKVLKNTNKNKKDKISPYEPLEAELLIQAKDNRHCVLSFNTTRYSSFKHGKSPLRLLTVFHDNGTYDNYTFGQILEPKAVPGGYSEDKYGNDHFKWLKGIDQLQLHKTNWTQEYFHIGLLWIPRWFDDDNADYDDDDDDKNAKLSKLGVHVECYWGEYDDEVEVDDKLVRKLPAYDELNQYSPNYVIYTKAYPGLVVIKKYIEL